MQVRLINKEGSSNKEYNITLSGTDERGYVVNFTYGKIGGPLKSGTKTSEPITLPKAEKIFDSLVNSKMKKGYVPDDALTDNVATQLIAQKESIGFKPMLSNPVSPQEIASRIEGGEWFMASIKADGERRPIHIHGGEVFAGNRRGERVPLREDFANALIKWADGLTITIDCEDMGDWLYVFDLMELGEGKDDPAMRDLRMCGFKDRMAHLDDLLTARPVPACLRIAKQIELISARDLDGLLAATRDAGEEGVVIRTWNGVYEAGRPSSGGESLKIKHTNSVTAVCDGVNDVKRSIKLILRDDDGHWRFVGSCTIPPNVGIPGLGARVEIEYLWANPNGSLIQPVWKGERSHEIEAEACTTKQLIIRDPESLRGAA